MRDIEDRLSLRLQPSQDPEESFELVRAEHGRGLIHDNDLGVERERPGDLGPVAPRRREPADLAANVEVEIECSHQFPCLPKKLPPVYESQTRMRQAAQEDVFCNRQGGSERRVLVHDCDAELHRMVRTLDLNRIAGEVKRAAVRANGAANDVHQRRLAGAVLADERVNLAEAHGKADTIERAGCPIALGNVVRLEREFDHVRPVRRPLRPLPS